NPSRQSKAKRYYIIVSQLNYLEQGDLSEHRRSISRKQETTKERSQTENRDDNPFLDVILRVIHPFHSANPLDEFGNHNAEGSTLRVSKGRRFRDRMLPSRSLSPMRH